jgi:diacylglycerol kinase family enzyme
MLIIVNPVSGTGKQDKALRAINKYLDRDQFDYEIAYTQAHRHAIELTKDAVAKKN